MRKPEDFVREHKAEAPNSGEPNNVSCWRSTRHPGRMAGKREFDEKSKKYLFFCFFSKNAMVLQ